MKDLFESSEEGMMWAYFKEAYESELARQHLLTTADFRYKGQKEGQLMEICAGLCKQQTNHKLELAFHYYQQHQLNLTLAPK